MAAKKMINPKTVGGVAGGVAALVAYLAVTNGIKVPFSGNSIERQIETFASDTNRRLPMQVDEVTRWDRVEAGPGKAYSCIYTVSKPLTEEEKRAVRENTTRRALEAPDMQATFEAGVTVWYRYYDTSGTKVLEFAVKNGD